MSAITASDSLHRSVSKSKRKKKTHKKGKNSGESTKVNGSAEATGEENGGEDDEELDLRNADILKEDSQGEEEGLTNATKYQNGAPNGTSEELGDKAEEVGEEDPHLSLPSRDATQKLDALAKERDALRAEVTELHKSLEQIQEKHAEEASNLQAQLKEIQQGKEHAETQYKTLLGKVNTIRSQLGERLKADAEELSRARAEIDELNDANRNMRANSDTLHSTVSRLSTENESQAREISDLRSRTSLSQQNWVKERDDLISREAYAKDEFANAKQAMQDWEVLALEERNMRENLQGKVEDLEERVQTQRDEVGRLRMERDMQTQTVDGLQRALQDLQDARKKELRDVVESSQSQLEETRKQLMAAEEAATSSQSELRGTLTELERALPFEKEVKEKNLLIGKLRHEAVILNDHLTKALRFLKKGKPEDNVDRQIVTNHLLHFLALDRSDPKKFQVLQLIAALLGWSDEEREQAGLANPKTASGSATPSTLSTSFNSLRIKDLSSYKRSPSTPNIASTEAFAQAPDSAGPGRESLAELWSEFLQREAEEGERAGSSRNASTMGHSRRASSTAVGRGQRESGGVGGPEVGRERDIDRELKS